MISSISGPGGVASFAVVGTHTYAQSGLFGVVITITNTGGQSTIASGAATVPGTPPIFGPTGQFLVTAQNTAIPATTTVGAFTYAPNPTASASIFTAAITWGDGHSTAGTVVGPTNGSFDVKGGNSYAQPGKYPVSITVQDQSGHSTTISSTVIVTPRNPAVFTGANFAVITGVPTSVAVATVTDANPQANKSNITADIAWGDGHLSSGTITGPDTNGLYTVTGTNTYASGPGPFNVTVSISDPSGLVGTANSVAQTTSTTISPVGTTFAITPGVTFSGTVATFTDSNPLSNKANISAVIKWGDGSSSNGTISGPDGGGVYTVTGTYNYSYGAGNGQGNGYNNATIPPSTNSAGMSFYAVTVTITDPSGLVAPAVTSTAIVTPPMASTIPFAGALAPSGNGPNALFGHSNTNRPAFSGTATPFSIVQIFARLYGVDATEPLGQAIADVNGKWLLDTGPLKRGEYAVTAIVTPPGGSPSGQILLQNGGPVYIQIPFHSPPHARAPQAHPLRRGPHRQGNSAHERRN
jgi:hypothetical protein